MSSTETKYNLVLVITGFSAIIFMMTYLGKIPLQSDLGITGAAVLLTQPHQTSEEVRVLITPYSASASRILREQLDIQHEFGKRFSANIKRQNIPSLLTLGDVIEIPVYSIQLREEIGPAGRNICGDLVCQGNEANTCPTDCGTTPFQRTCTPTNQKAYNTIQVNGGSIQNGKGVKVAVLDTGTLKTHPDLASNIVLCADTTKRGISKGCDDQNSVGHGTHAAGIIAANGGSDGKGLIGISPSTQLQIIKVCGSNGLCYADDIAQGIEHAARNNAQIISMSLGSNTESSLIKDAITKYPNILFIAAAGNSGPALDTINYPAANPDVIAVAAHDIDRIVASFSSRGLTDGNDAIITAREVEVSAGGVGVESTHNNGCYSALSGTSFSTPTITGVAAAIWDAADGLVDNKGNAASTKAYLRALTSDITTANGGGAGIGYDVASGYGMPVLS